MFSIGFWILAVLITIFALMVVFIEDLFRSIISLLFCFISIAALFITLNAEYVAILMVLVYGGAVAILYVFAVTLFNPQHRIVKLKFSKILSILAVFFASILTFTLSIVASKVSIKLPETTKLSISDLSHALFTSYLVPFELISILLLAAMVGALSIAKEEKDDDTINTVDKESGRA